MSRIEWTDATWNPVRGCSRVSEGCRNCYAERVAARFSDPGQRFHGFARRLRRVRPGERERGSGVRVRDGLVSDPRWTGKVELIPSKLDEPLRWRRPRRVFVNSMSDLFHEALPDFDIAAIFGVMAACPSMVFQVLTKRPKRMREWFSWVGDTHSGMVPDDLTYDLICDAADRIMEVAPLARRPHYDKRTMGRWPLPNVWLGVSCEDQATADERIPLLLQTPAAVRFVSQEPQLSLVDYESIPNLRPLWGMRCDGGVWRGGGPRINQVIVGGESGPGARPFHLGWASYTREQCRDAGVAFFYKQGGSSNRCTHSSKGGCLDCAPEGLRVREFPA